MVIFVAFFGYFILYFFFRIIYFYFCQSFVLVSILHNVASAEYWFFRCFIFFSSIDGSFLLLGFCFWCLCFLFFTRFVTFSTLWSSFYFCYSILFFFFCFCSKSSLFFVDALVLDGFSLNIILKNPVILVHPPFLYLSLALIFFLFWVLFLNINWRILHSLYLYFFISYVFLVAILFFSIVLGGFWAYYVLGWGGWWFWDPVELYAALFCLIILLKLHSYRWRPNSRFLIFWWVSESLFFFVLIFFLFVGIFYLRAGLVSSIHNFVLDFSSSWIFFFFSNVFFIFLFVVLYVFKALIGSIAVNVQHRNFLFFVIQYCFFNWLFINGFFSLFFNYLLFQEVFLFLNISVVFTFSCFFFFMWFFFSFRSFFPFFFIFILCFFFVIFSFSFTTPILYCLVCLFLLGVLSVYLLHYCVSYISTSHCVFLMLCVLALLNKFFSFAILLPLSVGDSFYIFDRWFFVPASEVLYNTASVSSILMFIQVVYTDALVCFSNVLYVAFNYSFFSSLLSYESLVFSFSFYDLQLFLLNVFALQNPSGLFSIFIGKVAISLCQGLFWGFCLLWLVLLVSWLLFFWRFCFLFK